MLHDKWPFLLKAEVFYIIKWLLSNMPIYDLGKA